MTALTKVIAEEEMHNGIRATVISPGRTNTPLLERTPENLSYEYRQKILQPVDVAAAVMFIVGLPDHVYVPELVLLPTIDVT